MYEERISCPKCKSKNLRSCALFEGAGVWCPICDKTFLLEKKDDNFQTTRSATTTKRS